MDTSTEKRTFGLAHAPRSKTPVAGRFIALRDLPDKGIYYSISHLRRMWKDDKFPKPTYLSERKFGWPEDVLDAWLAEKVKA